MSETWIDERTGLEWQVQPAIQEMNWSDAKAYAEKLDLAGGGWRLPTREELLMVVKSAEALRSLPISEWYWSSSQVEDYNDAWIVYFDAKGLYSQAYTWRSNCVRCVR